MVKRPAIPSELQNVGHWLLTARLQHGITQQDLATRAGLSQPRISGIEKGDVLPTLPQLVELARALAVPLQWFLTGSVTPGVELTDYAVQLQALKVIDLVVSDARVPGAFHPVEDVLALAVAGNQPNPRIIEAMPAVLAWNPWSPDRLRALGNPRTNRNIVRLAWLVDVALTIHRATGFPGGCPQQGSLESYLKPFERESLSLMNDDLGRPGNAADLPPVSKRWCITYDAPLNAFVERAERLRLELARRIPLGKAAIGAGHA